MSNFMKFMLVPVLLIVLYLIVSFVLLDLDWVLEVPTEGRIVFLMGFAGLYAIIVGD